MQTRMFHSSPARVAATGVLALFALVACEREAPKDGGVSPPGEKESPKSEVLEASAELLQRHEPAAKLDIYLDGFHVMRDDPSHQFEAHHFCHQVNEDFAQCALWDGKDEHANLNGIEYIISEELFETLPEDEKQYWHPHNFEILSGQLMAPGLPAGAELELMRGKMNSYGKTWHTWTTGGGTQPGTKLPLGEPSLAWSFNADGEIAPKLIERRDRAHQVDTRATRKQRQELVELAKPQQGVDLLAPDFPGRRKPRGVIDKREQPGVQTP